MSEDSVLQTELGVFSVAQMALPSVPLAAAEENHEKIPLESQRDAYRKFAEHLAHTHAAAHARIAYPIHWLLAKPTKK